MAAGGETAAFICSEDGKCASCKGDTERARKDSE